MIRRNTALLVATLGLTLAATVACHVSAECDVHRDNSGSCTVTVPPGGIPVTIVTQTTTNPPPPTTPPTQTPPPTTQASGVQGNQ